jgi:hypothetical protein
MYWQSGGEYLAVKVLSLLHFRLLLFHLSGVMEVNISSLLRENCEEQVERC